MALQAIFFFALYPPNQVNGERMESPNIALNSWIASAPDYRDDSDNPMSAFADAIAAAGLKAPFPIVIGKITRVPDASDTGVEKTGWYIFFETQDEKGRLFATGVYGSWRDGTSLTWSSRSSHLMSHSERIAHNKAVEEARAKQEAARAEAAGEAAIRAGEIYSSCKPSVSSHPYLKRKGVKAIPVIGVDDADNLIIPVTDGDGKIISIQRIMPDGTKRFLSGGKTAGGFFKIPNDSRGVGKVAICEGAATGLSIHEATGAGVYCALSAANIYATASHVSRTHSGDIVVICADDNSANTVNTGLREAMRAADVFSFSVVSPTVPKDFNDMHQSVGLDAVAKLIFPTVADGEEYAPKKYSAPESDKVKIPEPPKTGFIRDIYDYYKATSGNFDAGYAIQSALAIASVAMGRNYSTAEQNYTSLFFLAIGETGTGKEMVKKTIHHALKAANIEKLIANDWYTSAAAVISTLDTKPRHIVFADEFDKYIRASKSKTDSNGDKANGKLMECWGACDSSVRGVSYSTKGMTKELADRVNDTIIENPAITIMGACTEDRFLDAIGGEDIASGFLNRFLIYFSDKKEEIRRHKPRMAVPDCISQWLIQITARSHENGNADENPKEPSRPIILEFSNDAMELQYEFQSQLIEWKNKNKVFGVSSMAQRTNEIAMRLSMIYALAENPAGKIIELSHMEKGIEWAKFCLEMTADKIKRVVSSSSYEGDKKAVLQALRNFGAAGVSWSKMQKRPPFSKFRPKDLLEIMNSLVAAELAIEEVASDGKRGRPTKMYYAIED